jgi:S-DNA-T family DNA segregation ATPase FtsK/SpoIIIE
MRTIRRQPTPFEIVTDALRAFLARRARELLGLSLLGGAGAVVAALATWSVGDPSLNHATSAPVRNVLGFPGAAVADLVMQLVGLGAVALLAPVAAWGWCLLRGRPLDRLGLRVALWVAGSGAATGLASALPATARWPLPTGLGGVVGDALLTAGRTVTGASGGAGTALIGLAFAGVAILSITAACGFGFAEPDEPAEEPEPTFARRARVPEPDERDDAPRDDEPGWIVVALGAAAHGLISLKEGVRRQVDGLRRPRDEDDLVPAAPRAALRREAYVEPLPVPVRRREPVLDAEAPRPRTPEPRDAEAGFPEPRAHAARPPAPVVHDEEDEDEPWRTLDEPAAPAPIVEAPSRVSMPAAAPRPGQRLAEEIRRPAAEALRGEEYHLPELALLAEPKKAATPAVSADALEQNATLLESTLEDFGVRGEIINVRPGPVVTLYELEPAPGTKSSRVIALADDIARSMSAVSARVAVVPGRNAIGIELPNARRETVYLRELLASADFEGSKAKLALCLGKTIGGEPVIADLARMPHLLVAGTTGSGKSVAINTMILSLLYRLRPEECRLIMVDPKMLELSVYDGIPHLLSPVVTDPKKAVIALKWAVREMEERYRRMSKVGVRNIDGYNARAAEAQAQAAARAARGDDGYAHEAGEGEEAMAPLPYIVVIVDEMADLMMVAGKEIEGAIQRLAQMARAAGIHLIMATQRPSVDVITGTIKANFPTRISFQVTSKIDSRTILGEMGAEQLLGQGDMLYMAGGGRITRVHGPFCSDDEVEKVVAHLKTQGKPVYLEAVTADDEEEAEGDEAPVFDSTEMGLEPSDLYDQAVAVVLRHRKASTSYIQRRLQIGYNRAASLMERMEKEGIIGAPNHAGKREILLENGE